MVEGEFCVMIDRIEALEDRVGALVDKTNEAKLRITELQRQNRELMAIAEQKRIVDQENARLHARIRELEHELNARDDRESAAKDRLKTILNRIDALETEILELDARHE